MSILMRKKDLGALRKFYEEQKAELFTYALSMCRSTERAEDAVQSAFAGVLRMKRLPRQLRPFIFRSVRNAIVDQWRRLPKEAIANRPLEKSTAKSFADGLNGRLDVDYLLRSLNEQERECIVLKIYSQLTFREIASIHDVSIHTASSWYRRGIEKVRTAMAKEDKK